MFHRLCQRSVLAINSQRGASVLLLIAIAISSVTFSGVCSMMAQYGQRFQTQQIASGLKQESRIGLEVLTSELRLAGTGGAPGEAALLKIGKSEIWFNANLSSLQTVLSQIAQAGTRDLIVENGSGWPDGKQVILCSLDRCLSNRLIRAGRANALSVEVPLPAGFPAGSAVFVSNRVHYYLGQDDRGVPRVMREVDRGIGTLISGISDASIPQHDQLLNDAATGWFRSLRGMARILKLQVYGPVRPGLLCTVEVVAAAGQGGHTKKTVSVEFGTYSMPPLRAAIQTVGMGADSPSARSSSVLVYWGDLKAGGNVRLINQEDVPEKSSQASLSEQSYGEMSHPQDRWFDMWVGGEVVFDRPQSSGGQILPENLHMNQDFIPGLKMDRWQYETLKRMAIQFGSYYGLDRDGRLHPGGVIHQGEDVAADEVLSARGVGDHHGLVFIDTLDQQPPRVDNLGTLTLNSEYMEGMFVMNAHVIWNPTSSTKFVPALSPPPEGQQSMGLRIRVQLSAINLRGVLYTAGNLVYCGRPRVFGGIMTEGALRSCPDQNALLEVWYDHDLGEGLHRGVPIVYMAPGTWRTKL